MALGATRQPGLQISFLSWMRVTHVLEARTLSVVGSDTVESDHKFGVALALISVLVCSGCRATLPSDLRLEQVTVVDVSGDADLRDLKTRYALYMDDPRQWYLKITLSTATNLGLLQSRVLGIRAFFCDTSKERRQEDYLALLSMSGLYAYGRDISMSGDQFSAELNTVPVKRYEAFIAVESMPRSRPPEVWDLRLRPRTVCLRLEEPDYPPVKSNVVEIPRSVIAKALHSPEPSGG